MKTNDHLIQVKQTVFTFSVFPSSTCPFIMYKKGGVFYILYVSTYVF